MFWTNIEFNVTYGNGTSYGLYLTDRLEYLEPDTWDVSARIQMRVGKCWQESRDRFIFPS